jgi:hypothetical protein
MMTACLEITPIFLSITLATSDSVALGPGKSKVYKKASAELEHYRAPILSA